MMKCPPVVSCITRGRICSSTIPGAEVASAENPDRLSESLWFLNPRKKVGQILEEPLLINTS